MPRTHRLQAVIDLAEEQLASGLHAGAQLFVSLRGETQIDLALGESTPGRSLAIDDLMLWYSASKPVTAVAVLQLVERGLLRLDDPIAKYVDGWGAGKERCTIRHVLTHTGGFAMYGAEPFDEDLSYAHVVAKIAAHPAEYPPGTAAGYHATTGWKILGAVVEVVDNRSIDQYVGDEIFTPLGINSCRLGIPLDEQAGLGARIVPVQWKGHALPKFGEDGGLAMVAYRIDEIHNEPWHIAKVEPAAGIRGSARELGRFYEALIGYGPAVLNPQTVETMIAIHRWGMPDRTYLNQKLPWGLGVEVASKIPGHPGRRAFGHGGMASSRGLADPDCGLVLVYVTNGLSDPFTHEKRMREMVDTTYDALGDEVAHLRSS